jgi:uroporphyrinogen-III synthase
MSSQNKLLNIIVLKTNDQINKSQSLPEIQNEKDDLSNNINDRYVEFLSSKFTNLQVESIEQINLLKFEYCNLEELKDKLIQSTCLIKSNNNNLHSSYKCIILTSRQTCEAIEISLVDFINNDCNDIENIDDNNFDLENKFIVYCVGQSTANRFKQIVNKLRILNSSIDRLISIRTIENLNTTTTEHKQNAKQLASLIIKDYEKFQNNESRINFDKYALYPCSSIRKDDLYNELSKHHIHFDEIIAYRTVNCELGIESLRNRLLKLSNQNTKNLICLVFFSPSACDAVINSNAYDLIRTDMNKIRLLSIGPSTTSKLKSYFANNDIYQLDEPTPQSLFEKLNLFIQ